MLLGLSRRINLFNLLGIVWRLRLIFWKRQIWILLNGLGCFSESFEKLLGGIWALVASQGLDNLHFAIIISKLVIKIEFKTYLLFFMFLGLDNNNFNFSCIWNWIRKALTLSSRSKAWLLILDLDYQEFPNQSGLD